MPRAEERFDQASDNTRAFLKGTVQEHVPQMPKRPKVGQMRQVRQIRGRFNIAKLPQTPKLDRFPLSFERGTCGRCGRHFEETFSLRE